MKVAVFGLGYVGSVTAIVLANAGHQVVGIDVQPWKVQAMNEGTPTIVEPRLTARLETALRQRTFEATLEPDVVADCDVSLICVGTPSLPDGDVDISAAKTVLTQIGRACRPGHVVALRSTVLPGYLHDLRRLVSQASLRRVSFCVNPEFLREGSAVEDFYHPPFTLLGGDVEAVARMTKLYKGLAVSVTTLPMEEVMLVKYISNAWHALKVSFANEIGALARDLGLDGQRVMSVFGRDDKLNISTAYLRPGAPYGGSCLPKDTAALQAQAARLSLELPLLESISRTNFVHLLRAVQAMERTGDRRVALVGLAFKPGTGDLRFSPYVTIAELLRQRGVEVRAYDPEISDRHAAGYANLMALTWHELQAWNPQQWLISKPYLVPKGAHPGPLIDVFD